MATDRATRARAAGAGVAGSGPARSWPLLVLAAPAFVAIWSGWVGLGSMTGFGTIEPLPGIWDGARLDTAITLPIGVEAYAAYALHAWLTPGTPARAVRFARRSTIASLVLGAAGQVAYHLMTAAGITRAPWPVTAVVASLPVAVLGMGAALAHLLRVPDDLPGDVVSIADREVDDVAAAEPAPGPRAVAARPSSSPVSGPVSSPVTSPVSGTGEQARRLRAQDPDLTTVQIARRLGVSDRTVRRHLNSTGHAVAGIDQGPDARPDRVAVPAGKGARA